MDSTCRSPVSSNSPDSPNLSGATDLERSPGLCLRIPLWRHVLFWTLAILGCSADLMTKHWAFSVSDLRGGAVWWLWEGHAGFQQSLNEGALFGLGQGQVGWFAIFSFVALVAIPLWLFCFGAAGDLWLLVTLGCIVGGIVGNLYDRLGWHGRCWEQFITTRSGPVYAVRDWILWCWDFDRGLVWPNFNIADSLLVCGAVSLVLHAYWSSTLDAARRRLWQ